MRVIVLAAVMAATSCCAQGCDVFDDVARDTVPVLQKCGGPVAGDLMGKINALLFRDGSRGLSEGVVESLDDLALKHGPNVVACLVEQFIGSRSAPGASTDPANVAAVGRAQIYLEMRRPNDGVPTASVAPYHDRQGGHRLRASPRKKGLTMPLRVALIDDTGRASGDDLRRMEGPLGQNLLDAWRPWRHLLPLDFRDAEPTVMAWDDSPLPGWSDADPLRRNFAPIYLTDDDSRSETALAIHYHTGIRPEGSTFMARGSGLWTGHSSASENTGHEAVEILGNPTLTVFHPVPGMPGWKTPQELCDGSQEHYEMDFGFGAVRVPDILYPAWFGLDNHPDFPAEQMNHNGTLSSPGELSPEGYRVIVSDDWTQVRYQWGARRNGFDADQAAAQARPLARTRRVIESCHTQARERLAA